MKDIHFAAICGSIRNGSYNRMVLNACKELLPENTSIEIAEINMLPHYNADLDIPQIMERPAEVEKIRKIFHKADGVVIASPEYNFSIPGVLKNAIDWLSRGVDAPLIGKPVSIMGASSGMWGSVKMQVAILPVLHALEMTRVPKPEILIAEAAKKFDANGELTDKYTRELISKNLLELKKLCLKSIA